jgi:hypothetical protein
MGCSYDSNMVAQWCLCDTYVQVTNNPRHFRGLFVLWKADTHMQARGRMARLQPHASR